MSEIYYSYQFNFPDGNSRQFRVNFSVNNLHSELLRKDEYPQWTQLEYHQCHNCPLSKTEHLYCPLAVNLIPIIYWCEDLASYDVVDVIVESAEREVRVHTSLQRAVSSLLGLLMSSSACPQMKFLQPMARFHLPLATHEETIFRVVSMSFLKKYFDNKGSINDGDVLLELKKHYHEIQEINRFMADRFRGAIKRDAAINAIVLLDILSKKVSFSIDDSLKQIRYIFEEENTPEVA